MNKLSKIERRQNRRSKHDRTHHVSDDVLLCSMLIVEHAAQHADPAVPRPSQRVMTYNRVWDIEGGPENQYGERDA